jgi:hypothetical protein
MQVVKNMLTSVSNKGPYMKSFFVLLLPVVLQVCVPAFAPAHLSDTRISDAGLVHLKGLTSLRSLGLTRTKITDVGLENLTEMTSLRMLYLSYTQVADAGLVHLKGLTSLTWLNVSSCPQITDAGLAELKAALPKCVVNK